MIGLLCATAVSAQEPPSQPASSHSGWWNGNPSFVVPIREVSVTARCPMKEIGVQQTKLDTTVLHENIALSMADVLTFNTSIFVKQYGRATLSTVAFRGTSPSHTQVTWNGMRINSPMLGMTDFSMIPSYFIDDATLLHGTSSVNMTGGGLGGAVALSTRPAETRGFNMQYVQGIGSFSTFDEFLRLTYGSDRWQTSTRVVYSSSSNDFRYRNYNKKMNIYDDDPTSSARTIPSRGTSAGISTTCTCSRRLITTRAGATGSDCRRGISIRGAAFRCSTSIIVPIRSIATNSVNKLSAVFFRGIIGEKIIRSGLVLGIYIRGRLTISRRTKVTGTGRR